VYVRHGSYFRTQSFTLTEQDSGEQGKPIIFHHIKSNLPGSNGVHAVYLDDCASGITAFGNTFHDISGRAILCGGGRDNTIENNVKDQDPHFVDEGRLNLALRRHSERATLEATTQESAESERRESGQPLSAMNPSPDGSLPCCREDASTDGARSAVAESARKRWTRRCASTPS